MEQDIETLIQNSKDAQRYEEIQSGIRQATKTMKLYRVIIGLNIGTAGIFGAASGMSYSNNHDDLGLLQLITSTLFAAAFGFNYLTFRANKKKRESLMEEAKEMEARQYATIDDAVKSEDTEEVLKL